MMRALALSVLCGLLVAGCGQRPEPLMPDHFGSGAQAPGSDGPRALMAVLRPTTDLAVEGALVAMPGADRVVFGGAIDQLTAGRYRLATASSGGCADPKPTETVGEFDATDFGQGKF